MEEKEQSKAELLKKEILKHYKSVRAFCLDMDIPYSTLVTALDRGIEGMAYGTVLRMCEKLSLNPVDFTPMDENSTINRKLVEKRVLQSFMRLNRDGRHKMLEFMDDFGLIEKYKL